MLASDLCLPELLDCFHFHLRQPASQSHNGISGGVEGNDRVSILHLNIDRCADSCPSKSLWNKVCHYFVGVERDYYFSRVHGLSWTTWRSRSSIRVRCWRLWHHWAVRRWRLWHHWARIRWRLWRTSASRRHGTKWARWIRRHLPLWFSRRRSTASNALNRRSTRPLRGITPTSSSNRLNWRTASREVWICVQRSRRRSTSVVHGVACVTGHWSRSSTHVTKRC